MPVGLVNTRNVFCLLSSDKTECTEKVSLIYEQAMRTNGMQKPSRQLTSLRSFHQIGEQVSLLQPRS